MLAFEFFYFKLGFYLENISPLKEINLILAFYF